MNINQEKERVIDSITKGSNVFISGSAGTGKSFLINLIKEKYNYAGCHVTASTGIAAVKISGMTIHSWAGLGTGESSIESIIKYVTSGKATNTRRRIKAANMLIIDEISMISGDLFDKLNQLLKVIRDTNLPFGGIQLIVVGDFFQLPPVNKYEELKYCFESEAWQEANFCNHVLEEIFRQNNEIFIKLLNRLRYAKLNDMDIKLLKEREILPESESKPTILTTHNAQANMINEVKIAQLSGQEYIYYLQEKEGTAEGLNFLKNNCLAPEKLILKKGAQVMMLKNHLQKDNIVNGSLGIVESFTEEGLPKVRFYNNKLKTIEPQEWSLEFHDPTLHSKMHGIISQIPLSLAWAITIHKAQGLTLDSVYCDLGKIFAEGQVYVALSRAKCLEQLYIKNFDPLKVRINSKVVEFYKK